MKSAIAMPVFGYGKGRHAKLMDDASPMPPPPSFGRHSSADNIPYHLSDVSSNEPLVPTKIQLQRSYSCRIRKCMAGLRSVSFRRNNTMQGHSKHEQTEASSCSITTKSPSGSFHESEKNEPHEHQQTQNNDRTKANGDSKRSCVSFESTSWHLADLHSLVNVSEEPRPRSSRKLEVLNPNHEAIAEQDSSSFDKPNESPSSTPRTVRPSSSSTLGSNDVRSSRHRNRSRHSSSRQSLVNASEEPRSRRSRKLEVLNPNDEAIAEQDSSFDKPNDSPSSTPSKVRRSSSSTLGSNDLRSSRHRNRSRHSSSRQSGVKALGSPPRRPQRRSSFESPKGGKSLDECRQAVLREKKGALPLKTSTNQRINCDLRRIRSLEPAQTFPRSTSRWSMEPKKTNSKVLGRSLDDDTADAHLEIHVTPKRGGRPVLTRNKGSRSLPGGTRGSMEPKKAKSQVLGRTLNDDTADVHLEIHVTTKRGGRPALTRYKSSRYLPGFGRRQLSANPFPAEKSA